MSHLIGHEGKGSILSELRSRGWSNSLLAGHSTSARGFGFFDILVDLTKEGFDNIDEITKIIFQVMTAYSCIEHEFHERFFFSNLSIFDFPKQYINMLRCEGPKKWIFEEYLNMSEMQFRFKDKETALLLVSSVVHSMQLYPMEEVLTAPYIISEWRPELIQNLIDDLAPEKCRIVVIGQKIESICDETEYWYGTKYHSEPIPDEVIQVNALALF